MTLPAGGLYAIADTAILGADPTSAVEAALTGGAVLIQYRDKTRDDARRRREARALQRVCRDNGVGLIINDDVELAIAIGADGVHLGADDISVRAARARLPEAALIGMSCYDSSARAEQAIQAGADYIAFGSFYPSPTKPDAVRAPLDLLTAARELPVPVVAIGGITPANGAALIKAGADFLAVISGVFGADDVCRAAQSYSRLFETPGQRNPPPSPPSSLREQRGEKE